MANQLYFTRYISVELKLSNIIKQYLNDNPRCASIQTVYVYG